jgi:eukaryotic-like serine/threonine-protein kinase
MARGTPRWWVVLLSAAFLAYFALLVYCDVRRPEDYGFDANFTTGRMVLTRVASEPAGSPAARAGLAPADLIVEADGRPIRSLEDWTIVDSTVEFGRPIHLRVLRHGELLQVELALAPAPWSYWKTEPGVVLLGFLGLQLVSLAFGMLIVVRRPNDRVALLGAWALATFAVYTIVPPHRFGAVWRNLPPVVGVLMWAPYISSLAVAAVLFTFFASFPRRIVQSRRLWAMLWAPMGMALILPVRDAIFMVYQGVHAPVSTVQGPWLMAATAAYTVAGLSALVFNYRRLTDLNERRRVKVLVIGAVGGLLPGLLVVASYRLRSHANLAQSIFASRATSFGTLSVMLFPASFAYAILRHRLFDIGMMIRQGVRYAVARGVLVSVVPALAVLLVGDVLMRGRQPLAQTLEARAWVYAAIAGLAVVAHGQRQRWLRSLDRHFFREHYDAQQLLRRVVEDIRQVGDFTRVAPRVVAQIEAALHPEFVALLVREPSELHYRSLVAVPAGLAPPPLRVDSKLVALLRIFGKPLEVACGHEEWLTRQLPAEELDVLRQCRIDLLVPIVTHPERAESVLALGVKRSEEPYSQEDCDLLAIIAANLALLLERSAPSPRLNDTFDECPQCGACWDSGTVECEHDRAALVAVHVPRLLATRYRLDRRLGRGGFGTVYSGFDTALDRPVAVKMIRDDLLTDPDVARRFQREARLAAAFVHPNVVTVYDFGMTTAARAFLVMELLDGATLRDALRQDRFGPVRALAVMRGVCAAMDAGHRRQLLHRDLKPENIILVKEGDGETAKVLDFGVARTLNDARDSVSDAGRLVGTLRYMAPAQLRGEDGDSSSDVWALGVIAYEMLTGAHPFEHFAIAGSSDGTAYRQMVARPLSDSPAGWRSFFGRALAIDTSHRPASAAAFLTELELALA